MASATRNSIRLLTRRLTTLDHYTSVENVRRCISPDSRLPIVLQKFFSGWSRFALNPVVRSGDLLLRNERRSYSSDHSYSGGSDSGPPTESFGSMTAQSGITDDMLDSLIALKDFGNIEGLPPLDVILGQDDEIEKKAKRRELERQKQMELQSMRVKTVDEYGRAYATGRRKASIARVWLKEGEGKIIINGLPHDLYFPDIDQRLQLLEPFYQTKTLGLFDIRSTVKGGGITGQSGALRHGISKALQLFDPLLRPSLKSAGMLTRDSRVVERKKPGKAKARKSYQWVKR
ncbi:small subunit ribosomal protein S9 [Marchantia polymorpha subsp. ruderalis]|uniref:Small ribosomal subunit protein uS9c n=2 Tax=Marchantia polymorpha TaxID=3197 RepID=A0A176W0Q6_MARPO|nr:hypothetical protein AXG93_3437s1000 [Marchantia polymorpha subsp. ruderalis]PTQ27676.1 hypothetical protein MARPO_0187s0001 [Marchantia polymorpha]BBN19948.1 hypothetical protein Mp_8g15150 [Marchantia polymorpha subsp. ruderalis]|eukprot:PTQ27676.1 hypothetical protein MARPO_0187s0001 [Marchantia polymorpha]